jgi:hypothetical protein
MYYYFMNYKNALSGVVMIVLIRLCYVFLMPHYLEGTVTVHFAFNQ